MQIEVFSLCDAATGDLGKLSILGAFDTINAKVLPFVFPQCSIAFRARFLSVEQGEHKIRMSFMDEDGKNVIPPLESKVDIKFIDNKKSMSINMVLNLHNVKFERFGEYSIDLVIDGKREANLPLYVVEKK